MTELVERAIACVKTRIEILSTHEKMMESIDNGYAISHRMIEIEDHQQLMVHSIYEMPSMVEKICSIL